MMDIVLENVSKSFGDKAVLRDFSARFPAGEVTCVMGPSGCGKTTLLRLLLGLERPDSGRIAGVPERKAAVFQEDRLCPGLSLLGNVLLPVDREKPAEARALLTRLGLDESLDVPARELSGGMRRRAALARALLYDAPLLTLDEPFTGLDEASRAAAAEAVREYARGKTVIFVTHIREEAALLEGKVPRILLTGAEN